MEHDIAKHHVLTYTWKDFSTTEGLERENTAGRDRMECKIFENTRISTLGQASEVVPDL